MSAISSVHQANAQALAQIHAHNEAAEDRMAADAERLAKQEEQRHQQVVEEMEEGSTQESLDTVA